jgi:hypothetical protein
VARFRMIEVAFSASGAYWIDDEDLAPPLEGGLQPGAQPLRRRELHRAVELRLLGQGRQLLDAAVPEEQGPAVEAPVAEQRRGLAGPGGVHQEQPGPLHRRRQGERIQGGHHLVPTGLQRHPGHLEEQLAVGADEDLHDIDHMAKSRDFGPPPIHLLAVASQTGR